MSTPNLLASLKTNLVTELENLFSRLKQSELSAISDSFDELLITYLLKVIRQYSALLISDAKEKSSSTLFAINGLEFEIVASEDLIRPEVLQVAFIRRNHRSPVTSVKTITTKVVGVGRYQKIKILYSPEIPLSIELTKDVAITILETGYKWLERAVLSLLSSTEINLARSLYSFVRTVFKNPKLLERFWFVSVAKEQCIYLFDERATTNAMIIASKEVSAIGMSPLSITSEILNCFVPYELIAAKVAIEDGRCIDVRLDKSKYIESEALLATAEVVMYGSEEISVFPIVRHGKAYLVAGFPTLYKNDFETELRLYHQELIRRFEYFQKSLERILENLKRKPRSLTYGKIGELIGGFTKSFLDL